MFSVFVLISFFSCGTRERDAYKEFKINELSTDTSKLFVNYKNTVFFVASPQFVNLYLRRLGIYPVKTAINKVTNIEKYTTSSQKALNLGVYGADLGYMNIFLVSDITNEYVSAINQLSNQLDLGLVFTRDVYNQILALKDKQDSLAHYLSIVFGHADQYLKESSQQQTSALVIAGGWIESFYLLCQTYNNYKSKEIRDLIFQQKFVLENLIKGLAPYYESSAEMQDVIDNLVELAYDFDMLDFKYTYENPVYKIKNGVMVFNNGCHVMNSPESLETIIKTIEKVRQKVIS